MIYLREDTTDALRIEDRAVGIRNKRSLEITHCVLMEFNQAHKPVRRIVKHAERRVVALDADMLNDLPQCELRAVGHIFDAARAAEFVYLRVVRHFHIQRKLTLVHSVENIEQIRSLYETCRAEKTLLVVGYRKARFDIVIIHRAAEALIVEPFVQRLKERAVNAFGQCDAARDSLRSRERDCQLCLSAHLVIRHIIRHTVKYIRVLRCRRACRCRRKNRGAEKSRRKCSEMFHICNRYFRISISISLSPSVTKTPLSPLWSKYDGTPLCG